jgi:drug/metabolite transporter (DMT)-like permease
VVAVVQALVGIVLLVLGYRPTTWLHYVYGFGPLVLLAIAHAFAREEPLRAQPWVPFAWAAFFCFGLALRALTTGLGYA